MASTDHSYYDYDPKAPVTCRGCGWTGSSEGHEEFFRELLEVTCPGCRSVLLVVLYPTIAETTKAAAEGNAIALENLPSAKHIERRLERADALQLKDPEQLPDLAGSHWRIDWDCEDRDGERWTVLRYDGQEIWRELAFYEGYERFESVFHILRRRYGSGLAEVRPTRRSELYLYGDSVTAHVNVERLNAGLRGPES